MGRDTGVLYVVDLDGTLLDDAACLSATSRGLLAASMAEGLPITVASARSVVAIRQLLAGLALKLPVVEFNGAFLSDPATGRHLRTHALGAEVAASVHRQVRTAGHHPFVSTFDGERDRLYAPSPRNAGMAWYLDDRRAHADARLTSVEDESAGLADEVVCFTVIDAEAPLGDLHEGLRRRWGDQVQLHLQENRYCRGWYWLTVHDRRATKDQGLRALLDGEGMHDVEIVAFGDEINDLGLFELAHRAVAPANAVPCLKARADEVIGANTEDSVARYIHHDWRRRQRG